jgi:aspartyl/asparaginyl beta-hydroxylase (cupin superfamily)
MYNREDLIEKAVKAIKDNNLTTIEEAVSYLPCSRQTFYNQELDKLDIIKEAIDNEKMAMKQKMKRKWLDSDASALQIALMRLICTDEERQKLAMNYSQNEIKVTKPIIIDWSNNSPDTEAEGSTPSTTI